MTNITKGTRNRRARRCFLVLSVLFLGLAIPQGASGYYGFLTSSPGVVGGLNGGGDWLAGGMFFDWNVTENPNGSWNYNYTFEHVEGGTSHFILEVSSTFTLDDIVSASGDFTSYELGSWSAAAQGNSNPDMPDETYGIKFDEAWGTLTHINLVAWRPPMWGDFYAADGRASGDGWNVAWNSGFTTPDTDPLAPISDNSVGYHILVPDTQSIPPIPEPTSLLLLGVGVAGAYLARRRRARG